MFPLLPLLFLFLGIATLLPLAPLRRSIVTPIITIVITVVNLFVFFVTYGSESSVEQGGLGPLHASVPRLFTYMFLHGDIFHLLSNTIILALFGRHIEEALGKLKYILLYFGSGIASGLFYVLMTMLVRPTDNDKFMIGASGAIFGLLGMFAVRFWRTKVRLYLIFSVPAYVALGLFVVLQVLMGLLQKDDGVAYMAHIGGFLFGSLIAWPLQMKQESKREYDIEDAEAATIRGDWETARQYYVTLLEQSPNDPLLHTRQARIALQQGYNEAAARHFREAIVGLLQRNGNTDGNKDGIEALHLYQEATKELGNIPLGPTLLSKLASVCEGIEQFRLAVDFLALLCREFPDSPETEAAMIRLGRLHLTKLGQPTTALGILVEFLRLYPHSSLLDHARQLKTQAEKIAAG
jgi:membrane associated rhomboid family serine protease